MEMHNRTSVIKQNPEITEHGLDGDIFDDDGCVKRTGTLLTASAHIITAVIGSGVLSLAWAIAQLGWIAGPIALMTFAIITLFTSTLLADCYRSPDPLTGKRNYTYSDAVGANLGSFQLKLCGVAQYANLVGVTIGYTITASISLAAIIRSNCFHKNGQGADCHVTNYPFMIIFAIIQIILSQIPNFHKLSWLSIVAAIMSFAYAIIGLGLAASKLAGGSEARTTLTGVTIGVDFSQAKKVYRVFQSLGNIASAYFYSTVLIEIQNTLKSGPPENKVMKKAATIGVSITTVFYMLCGCVGYAAFGNGAPGNFLTGFGVYEPYWLIDLGNACIVVHLIGAYQVFAQPIFSFVEEWCQNRWPNNGFITSENGVNIPLLGVYNVNFFRLVWRTMFVVLMSVVAMILPFFNDIFGLIGAAAFWPLTVYFPVEMYLAQSKLETFSAKRISLKILSWACCIVSIVAAVGSIQSLIENVGTFKTFS